MDRLLFTTALLLGALSVVWMGRSFMDANFLAFTVTAIIGGVYILGAAELFNFRRATASLSKALNAALENVADFESWLDRLHPSLRHAVRLRVEGQRVGLPAPVLSPYLVGLLVMLGLLGTFIGMVDTLKGAVMALEGTTELQAIRQGLAAPIKGLSQAFGTSVAGVAASAMLGLMSTLSRRQRIVQTRRLDGHIATGFKAFSLVESQRETFKALQTQTQALPAVAGMLESMATKLERLGDRMFDNQDRFHRSVTRHYSQLTVSLEQALAQNLSDNVRLVGDAIVPVVKSAMTVVTQETQQVHRHLTGCAKENLADLSRQMRTHSQTVAESLHAGVVAHHQSNAALTEQLGVAFGAFQDQFDGMARSMLAAVDERAAARAALQASVDEERLGLWRTTLDEAHQQAAAHLRQISKTTIDQLQQTAKTTIDQVEQTATGQQRVFAATTEKILAQSSSLATRWGQLGEAAQARQEELAVTLEQAAVRLNADTRQAAVSIQSEMSRLVESSDALIHRRETMEAAWLEDHASRMGTLGETLRVELGALRDAEARRGQAAVARLEKLESVLAAHLLTLGQGLEEPITQLIQSAAEAPRAAMALIEQLRETAATHAQGDQRRLDDHRRVLEQLDQLSKTLTATATEQGAAVEQLVADSRGMMEDVARRFSERVGAKVSNFSAVADSFAGSAVEMASLGEAFGTAVDLFNTANDALMENLTHIATALDQTTARSDDQLGYYVAQAREIIDFSMLSQKEIVDELRQIRPRPAIGREAD